MNLIATQPAHPPDEEPTCQDCGQPLDPHACAAGQQLCAQCKHDDLEFRAALQAAERQAQS